MNPTEQVTAPSRIRTDAPPDRPEAFGKRDGGPTRGERDRESRRLYMRWKEPRVGAPHEPPPGPVNSSSQCDVRSTAVQIAGSEAQ
jgi:hypothetical protein